jgi:hypothetical protein
MKNQNLMLKAAQQALSDALGYDEARAYSFLLLKNDAEMEKEFSYSKRYRILKSLFDYGAVGKFKQKDKDFFSYVLLPPSFLYFNEEGESIDKEIVEFLESLYLENHSSLLEQEFSQMMIKDERPLLAFLLKYFMKDSAKMLMQELDMKKIVGDKMRKVTMMKSRDDFKRSGIIDKNLSFEFVKVPNRSEREYIGYITHEIVDEQIFH